jgi:hypothetical protein
MPLLIGVGVLLLFVLLVNGVQDLKDKRRNASLRRQAEAMGFTYSEDGDPRLLALPAGFLLFAQGVPSGTKNAIQRPWSAPTEAGYAAPELAVFEYGFNVRFGRYLQNWRQTVVRISSDTLTLPAFSVMPQRVFEALATRARDPELREMVLGSPQIKLPQYPSFAERTHIHGYDRLAVQALFDDPLVALFDSNATLCLEASGSVVVLYAFDKVAKADELPGLVTQANEVLAMLQAKSTPSQ